MLTKSGHKRKTPLKKGELLCLCTVIFLLIFFAIDCIRLTADMDWNSLDAVPALSSERVELPSPNVIRGALGAD